MLDCNKDEVKCSHPQFCGYCWTSDSGVYLSDIWLNSCMLLSLFCDTSCACYFMTVICLCRTVVCFYGIVMCLNSTLMGLCSSVMFFSGTLMCFHCVKMCFYRIIMHYHGIVMCFCDTDRLTLHSCFLSWRHFMLC